MPNQIDAAGETVSQKDWGEDLQFVDRTSRMAIAFGLTKQLTEVHRLYGSADQFSLLYVRITTAL